jgi:hypothetical protein
MGHDETSGHLSPQARPVVERAELARESESCEARAASIV